MEQLPASACEYLLSAPHSVHAVAPAAEYLPTAHVATVEVPSQVLPAAQFVQVVRVLEVPPLVYDVVGH